jgi:glutamyl-tRNA reductase
MSQVLICGGVTFEVAPVELRERVAFLPAQLPEALPALKTALCLHEAVLISTCNRVEYFGATTSPASAAESWPLFLREFHELEREFNLSSFHFQDRECVSHLYEVAAGLKSMVIGETEVLGQLKDAYKTAQREGATGKWLNRLFQSSFAAAKEVRTRTGITRGNVSVASVAVGLAEKIFGQLENCRILIIGAGDTSEKTLRALQSRGAQCVLMANRTFDRAAGLAEKFGGRAVSWDHWEEEAVAVDIIISSTSAPHYMLTHEKVRALLRQRGGKPLFLIDLAVPRDFEPAINRLDDVYLYDLDDLQSIAQTHLHERQAAIVQSHELLKPHIARFCSWAEQQQEAQRLAALGASRYPA